MLFHHISVITISPLHAVHTEGVSVSTAVTHSKAIFYLLSSKLYAVGVVASVYREVFTPHIFLTC